MTSTEGKSINDTSFSLSLGLRSKFGICKIMCINSILFECISIKVYPANRYKIRKKKMSKRRYGNKFQI